MKSRIPLLLLFLSFLLANVLLTNSNKIATLKTVTATQNGVTETEHHRRRMLDSDLNMIKIENTPISTR